MPDWRPLLSDRADIFVQERHDGRATVLRSLAVRLDEGRSLVLGPMAGGQRKQERNAVLGEPAVLLAPNHYHNLGLRPWHEAYGSQVVCSAVAASRIQKKTDLEPHPLDAIGQLPDGVSLLEPAGTRSGEVWLSIHNDQGTTWVMGDAFFNLEAWPKGATGAVMAVSGVWPRLRIGPTFWWVALADRKAYATWLKAQLEGQRPTRLVPAHGGIVEGVDLTDSLLDLLERRG